MFSNTAYEALYQYLGLELHSQFITVITSEVFFKAMVLIIFGVVFFVTAIKFFSRYMPNTLVSKKHLPLSVFAKIIFCLFLGLALLRVGSNTNVRNYYGESWSSNPYIKTRYGEVKDKTGRMFRIFADHTKSDRRALAACMASSRQRITEEDISKIDLPVLVAVGSEDEVGGRPEPLAALMKQGESFVIEGRDHMRATGDKQFKQAVLSFLGRHYPS